MSKSKLNFCTSCGVRLIGTGFTRFPCPTCGHELGRCSRCRKQSNPYKCPECEFSGP